MQGSTDRGRNAALSCGMTPRQAALLVLAQFFLDLNSEGRRLTALRLRSLPEDGELIEGLLAGRVVPGLGWELSPQALARLTSGATARAAREAERRAGLIGARLLFLGEEGYPEKLTETEHAPPMLFLRGSPEALVGGKGLISMVGTRRPSRLGRDFAAAVAGEVAAAGFTVVSGLALGTDAAVHEAALDAGGLTVAVLASGVDSLTPRSNARLGRRILEEGGAVLSEMAPGTSARPRVFPFRNRIIAGLASRVAVFEAARGSGSTITGEFAIEYGRPLHVMPGRPGDPLTAGGLDLLAHDGARPLTEAADLLGASQGLQDPFAALGPDLRRLAQLLRPELPCTVDELAPRLGLSAPEQVSVLLGSINLLMLHGVMQEDLFGRLQFSVRLPPDPPVR